MVREAADVIDRTPGLCSDIEAAIAATYRGPGGRPRELPIRTALIVFVLLARLGKAFHLIEAETLIAGLTWRTRRHLGLAYQRPSGINETSYDQLIYCFNSIAQAFDAWDETLIDRPDEDEIRTSRAVGLAQLTAALIKASTGNAPVASGDLAVDATLKWSWERPPGNLNKKIERRGHDGDAGKPVALSDIVGDDTPTYAPSDPTSVAKTSTSMRTKRPKRWPKTWGLGSGWVGRANHTKSVHGVAVHTMVRSGSNEPNLIEGVCVTPAAADPVNAVIPLLAAYQHQRSNDPAIAAAGLPALGQVVADPAYTTPDQRFQMPLKAMGGDPVFRLHRTNQEGHRWKRVGKGARRSDVLFHNGRPMCECALRHRGIHEHFPKYPYTTKELEDYWDITRGLDRFEWIPNAAKKNGRQFLSPHGTNGGGCEHCVQGDGTPVTYDGKPATRCCQTRSRVFSDDELSLWQTHTFGQKLWYQAWNRRNRVEGSYGVMKNLGVTNYGRDYHHFVGLARETLVASFAAVAYNLHMLATWRARQSITIPEPPDTLADKLGFDPFVPTATIPAKTQAAGSSRRRRKGPKGLAFLGEPATGPPG